MRLFLNFGWLRGQLRGFGCDLMVLSQHLLRLQVWPGVCVYSPGKGWQLEHTFCFSQECVSLQECVSPTLSYLRAWALPPRLQACSKVFLSSGTVLLLASSIEWTCSVMQITRFCCGWHLSDKSVITWIKSVKEQQDWMIILIGDLKIKVCSDLQHPWPHIKINSHFCLRQGLSFAKSRGLSTEHSGVHRGHLPGLQRWTPLSSRLLGWVQVERHWWERKLFNLCLCWQQSYVFGQTSVVYDCHCFTSQKGNLGEIKWIPITVFIV